MYRYLPLRMIMTVQPSEHQSGSLSLAVWPSNGEWVIPLCDDWPRVVFFANETLCFDYRHNTGVIFECDLLEKTPHAVSCPFEKWSLHNILHNHFNRKRKKLLPIKSVVSSPWSHGHGRMKMLVRNLNVLKA